MSAQNVIITDIIKQIAETELQLEQTVNPRSRLRIKDALKQFNRDLARGLANKAAQEEDLTLQEDEEVDDFVLTGFNASDGEESNFYNFDENDVASDSSDASEVYEFRPQHRTSIPRFAPTRPARANSNTGNDGAESPSSTLHGHDRDLPSPQFDAQTGWFSGSMDQLQRMLRMGHPVGGDSKNVVDEGSSPGTPVQGHDLSGLDGRTIESYLKRYGGTDEVDDEVVALERQALV